MEWGVGTHVRNDHMRPRVSLVPRSIMMPCRGVPAETAVKLDLSCPCIFMRHYRDTYVGVFVGSFFVVTICLPFIIGLWFEIGFFKGLRVPRQ